MDDMGSDFLMEECKSTSNAYADFSSCFPTELNITAICTYENENQMNLHETESVEDNYKLFFKYIRRKKNERTNKQE